MPLEHALESNLSKLKLIVDSKQKKKKMSHKIIYCQKFS